MKIKEVKAKIIKNSRCEKTIEVSVRTEHGLFSSSAPSGKSKGRNEKKYYKKTIEKEIETIVNLSEDISKIDINDFKDLNKIEIVTNLGSNSLFALETAILKALSLEQGRELWETIMAGVGGNAKKNAEKFPFPVGNCIGGGLHTKKNKKPDFQEFLFIPKTGNFSDNLFLLNKAYEKCEEELKVRKVKQGKNDENALNTFLTNEEVLEIMKKVKEELENETGKKIAIGIDAAASTFFDGKYVYKNKKKKLNKKEQIEYILDLVDKFNLDYVEDPLNEEDFQGFSELRDKMVRARPTSVIVGDDLTVTRLKRFEKALNEKSINAIIIKPNQVGSLIEVAKVVKKAKENSIKTVFSHRSGETLDCSLADLAFGFQADYVKTGVKGRERKVKLQRLEKIEKSLKEKNL